MRDLIQTMKECLYKEAQTIKDTLESIDESSIDFAMEISQCTGKVVFTGVGKSFIVASKIAGTLSSIGVSSIAVNPLSMLHGDLGFFDSEDLLVALSNSGETEILLEFMKCVRKKGVGLLSITGNKSSNLAKGSKVTIEIKTKEAGPFGLVPTSSTTAMMAYGDALACALVELKGATIEDFFNNHPEGELSR